MSEFKDVQKLIGLKRYEHPGDDYFERFLDEFGQRQRSELLNKSARGILFERVQTWWDGLGKQGWVYGAGAAYAAVMLAFFLMPQSQSPVMNPVSSDSFPLSLGVERSEFDFDGLPNVRDGIGSFQNVGYRDQLRLLESDGSEPSIVEF